MLIPETFDLSAYQEGSAIRSYGVTLRVVVGTALNLLFTAPFAARKRSVPGRTPITVFHHSLQFPLI